MGAGLVGIRLGRSLPHGDAGVGVFNTLYATNHKFYGYADLFLDIPVHTAGHGPPDAAVKTWWDAAEPLRVSLDVHHFRAAEQGALSTSTSPTRSASQPVGPTPGASFSRGASPASCRPTLSPRSAGCRTL